MKSRKALAIIVAVVIVLAALGGFLAAKLVSKKDAIPGEKTNTDPASSNSSGTSDQEKMTNDDVWDGSVKIDGVKYVRNRDLTSILFLGIDYGGDQSLEEVAGTGGRSDTIMLLILDNESETTKLLAISRDTMTEVDVYKPNGDYAYSGVMHLTLQYSFGDSPRRSCYLTKKTVSELLFDTQIDGTFAMTLEGLRIIVDGMGGLTLTIPEDYTMIDSRYTKGATVTMNGEEAERFVRYRDSSVTGSNEERVNHQMWLITEVLKTLRGKIGLSRVEQLLELAEDYITSDLDADTLKKLMSYPMEETTYTLPGEVTEGAAHDEFYVDRLALRDLILELFYVPEQ